MVAHPELQRAWLVREDGDTRQGFQLVPVEPEFLEGVEGVEGARVDVEYGIIAQVEFFQVREAGEP